MQDKDKVISEAAVNNILFLISIAKEEAKKIGENSNKNFLSAFRSTRENYRWEWV